MKGWFCFALFLLSLPTGRARAEDDAMPASASGAPSLSLGEVLRSALTHHPQIVVERAAVEGVRADVRAAQGEFDPTLTIDARATPLGYYDPKRLDIRVEQPTKVLGATLYGGYRITRGKVAPYYGEQNTLDRGEVRGGLRVPLLQDRAVDARRAEQRRSGAALQAAEGGFDKSLLDLARDAATAYFAWVAARERETIAGSLVALAELRDAQVAEKVTLGALPDLERIDMRRSVLERRQRAISARRQREKAAIELSLFLRDARGAPRIVDANVTPESDEQTRLRRVPVQEAEARALRERPDLKAQTALVSQAQIERELAKNRVLPRLDAAFEVSRDQGSESATLAPTLRPTVVEAGLTFSMPLFLRKARAKVDAATSKLRATEAKAALARDRALSEVRDALSQVTAAEERSAMAKEAASTAQLVAKGERERFELGASTVLFVNLREQAAADAELMRVDAEQEVGVALVRALVATGEPPSL